MGFLRSEGGTGRAPRRFFPVETDPEVDPEGYSPRRITPSSTIPYPGSKGSLADWVISYIPTHDTYVEVFGGSAGVLINKPRSKYEIYNDINEDLTQFFRIVRNRPDDLAVWLQSVPYSRSQYEEWVEAFYEGVRPNDPVERAGRFFSLRYMQYAGVSSTANGFKTRSRRSPARTFDNARSQIQTLAERFHQVTIERNDYQEIFEIYDDSSVDVLFYVDPPYVDTENQYTGQFDHERFIETLHGVENDWILSCKTVPEAFTDHPIRERDSRHRMKRASGDVTEKLVFNFDPNSRDPFVS
ncbi:DNA adenine methylase [Halomicroarcula sp. GCM10025324]|uniref:DNA adenine methylase n=1 Tax=Haloarcula TaxID=2237 RepID=UPI0023E78D5A|nr:DNA adenine methylase [Halomicroarcula sp. ZS-22-S1]